MSHLTHRTAAAADVQFCDTCSSVSTVGQRARRRYEDTRTRALVAIR